MAWRYMSPSGTPTSGCYVGLPMSYFIAPTCSIWQRNRRPNWMPQGGAGGTRSRHYLHKAAQIFAVKPARTAAQAEGPRECEVSQLLNGCRAKLERAHELLSSLELAAEQYLTQDPPLFQLKGMHTKGGLSMPLWRMEALTSPYGFPSSRERSSTTCAPALTT